MTCRLKSYIWKVTWKGINREALSVIYTHLTYSLRRLRERERERQSKEERKIVVEHFLLFLLIILLFWRSLRGFLLYGFPNENICVLCIFYIIFIFLYLLFFQIEILGNLIISSENLAWYQSLSERRHCAVAGTRAS